MRCTFGCKIRAIEEAVQALSINVFADGSWDSAEELPYTRYFHAVGVHLRLEQVHQPSINNSASTNNCPCIIAHHRTSTRINRASSRINRASTALRPLGNCIIAHHRASSRIGHASFAHHAGICGIRGIMWAYVVRTYYVVRHIRLMRHMRHMQQTRHTVWGHRYMWAFAAYGAVTCGICGICGMCRHVAYPDDLGAYTGMCDMCECEDSEGRAPPRD